MLQLLREYRFFKRTNTANFPTKLTKKLCLLYLKYLKSYILENNDNDIVSIKFVRIDCYYAKLVLNLKFNNIKKKRKLIEVFFILFISYMVNMQYKYKNFTKHLY